MKQRVTKMLGIAICSACVGVIVAKLHTKCCKTKDNEEATRLINASVEHIVGTVLVRSRYALESAKGPIQMKIGRQHDEQIDHEPTIALEFVDADGLIIGIPFPKHEIIDNIGKLGIVAQHLSNIFEKEIIYI